MGAGPEMTAAKGLPRETATAVILGRAGSKGLPGKNAMLLAGRPMVQHSIKHARSAAMVGRILVSTDCPQVAAAARSEAVELIDRPTDLAGDQATVDAAARHALLDDEAPIAVILYANVPIRPAGLIDRAVSLLIETGADSVQSYAPVGKHHPYWEVKLDAAGRVSAYVENTVYRRQDLPPLFVPDGGVIAVRRASLYEVIEGQPHSFLGRDRRGIETAAGAVIDIDDRMDFLLAELILNESADCRTEAASHALR